MAIEDIDNLTRPLSDLVGEQGEKAAKRKKQLAEVRATRAAGMTADEAKAAAERGDFPGVDPVKDIMSMQGGDISKLDFSTKGMNALMKRRFPALILADAVASNIPDPIKKTMATRAKEIYSGIFNKAREALGFEPQYVMMSDGSLGFTGAGPLQRITTEGVSEGASIVNKLPQVNVKVKAGTEPDLSKLETIGTDGKIYVNINNKPVLKEDAIIKKTVLGEAGRNPRDQYRYALKTGVGKFISPEQDTFFVNIIKRRLEEGVPYANLRGSIQEYIRRDPDLLKQAEELEVLDFSNEKIRDRLKGIFRGTVKNVSDENLKTINYIKNAKTEQWYNIKQFTGFSEEGSKQAHNIKNQIVSNLPGNIRDQARKNLTMNIDRMAKFALRSGATEADVLKTLAKVDVDELAKIQAERITIQSRINLANKLGIDVDKANLSHKADVLKNWKLTLQSDNLFFAGAKANQQIQVAVNKEIDDLIAELGAVEFRRLRLGINVSKQEKEIAKKIKKLEQTLIDNDLISVVQGEKMGAKELVDDPRFTKKMLESVDNKILNRLQEAFGLELDKVDPKEIEKLIKQEISTKMFGDPAYFKKDGGIMSIEEIIQEPIRSKYTS